MKGPEPAPVSFGRQMFAHYGTQVASAIAMNNFQQKHSSNQKSALSSCLFGPCKNTILTWTAPRRISLIFGDLWQLSANARASSG
jgi:hypothetical protein